MTTPDRIINIAGASVFGVLGVAGLTGALFFGAAHHLATAAISALMVWMLWAEVRWEEKNNEKNIQ
jgi:hypothetical protein